MEGKGNPPPPMPGIGVPLKRDVDREGSRGVFVTGGKKTGTFSAENEDAPTAWAERKEKGSRWE